MSKIGEKVIAIKNISKDGEEVNIFGYGKYLGEKPCLELGYFPNPCIELSDGKIIWGYQCWWGNADQIEKEVIKAKKVNIVEVE